MQTIVIALIIITAIATITLSLILINNTHRKKKREKILSCYQQAGIDNNLSFTSQEVFNDRIIALDAIKRKLLVVEENDGQYPWYIIDLAKIQSCSVRKIYQSIPAGNRQNKFIEKHLEEIVLHFQPVNEKEPVDVRFYTYNKDHIYDRWNLNKKQNNGKPLFRF